MSLPAMGGYSEVKDATPNEQHLVDLVIPEIERKRGMKFKQHTATTFRNQIVQGTNYLIKIYVGSDEYLHAKIFQSLPCEGEKVTLQDFQSPKTKEDPLVPF
ncbi:cystatin-B-like [Bombina bombina]|uniref:cystatin-B-like n=1 Tax=Bombina bombina TaxID=8345 RepID=UPI00235AD2A0|nr:cystatin-B-like [Bombina bombina]